MHALSAELLYCLYLDIQLNVYDDDDDDDDITSDCGLIDSSWVSKR